MLTPVVAIGTKSRDQVADADADPGGFGWEIR
jgi:hypothetical protein